MKVTSLAYRRATCATPGAVAWHRLHHGAQNQNATSLPASDAPWNVPPPSSGASKSKISGKAGADGPATGPDDSVGGSDAGGDGAVGPVEDPADEQAPLNTDRATTRASIRALRVERARSINPS